MYLHVLHVMSGSVWLLSALERPWEVHLYINILTDFDPCSSRRVKQVTRQHFPHFPFWANFQCCTPPFSLSACSNSDTMHVKTDTRYYLCIIHTIRVDAWTLTKGYLSTYTLLKTTCWIKNNSKWLQQWLLLLTAHCNKIQHLLNMCKVTCLGTSNCPA